MAEKTAVVAFSGGLDTSYLAASAKDKYGVDHVTTVVVDTGGFSEEERAHIAARSAELGADEHVYINAEQELYDTVLRYMIYGNVTRDGYPMCVGPERYVQAEKALEYALSRNVTHMFHGSSGAGNDQYRFDSVIHVLGQGKIECVAPIREHNIGRDVSSEYLRSRGFSVSSSASYSYNVGIWGTSIGGVETHTAAGLIPEHAWYSQPEKDADPVQLTLRFERGEIAELSFGDTTVTGAVNIIKTLAALGSRFGIGRHYYCGTSIPGKKGRLAYESPAADIIYTAHAALEQITLTQAQVFAKKNLANDFGRLVHEARMYEPLADDLKAFLSSTQRRVTGEVTFVLSASQIGPCQVTSPHDLLSSDGVVYGETATFYTGAEAAGAARLHAFEQALWRSAE